MAYQDLRCLETVSSDFQAFCEACEQLEGHWGINPALRVGSHDSNIGFSMDNVSRRIIPANFCGLSYVPVKSTGNGNCLILQAWPFVKQKPLLLNCDYELVLNLLRTGSSTIITQCL